MAVDPATPPVGDAAAQLHRDAVVVDTHNDLLMLVAKRPRQRWASYFAERWLPQLRAGGVDVQVLPIYIDEVHRPDGALRQTLRMAEAAHQLAAGNGTEVALCLDGRDIDAALRSGRIALVLALEGSHGLDGDPWTLHTAHRLGVRVASFAHLGRTAWADGSGEDATGSRLTGAGVEALAVAEELGVLFDVSHLGIRGVDHVLELARRPVLATHSSARALRDHHRNLGDDHLRGIAATGGVVNVNFLPGFLDAGDHTVDRLVDHIAHIAGVAGVHAVGIGPDFIREVLDEELPLCDEVWMAGIDAKAHLPGLAGPAGLPLVTDALLRRGFDEQDVRGIVGGNALRVLRAEAGVPIAARATG